MYAMSVFCGFYIVCSKTGMNFSGSGESTIVASWMDFQCRFLDFGMDFHHKWKMLMRCLNDQAMEKSSSSAVLKLMLSLIHRSDFLCKFFFGYLQLCYFSHHQSYHSCEILFFLWTVIMQLLAVRSVWLISWEKSSKVHVKKPTPPTWRL